MAPLHHQHGHVAGIPQHEDALGVSVTRLILARVGHRQVAPGIRRVMEDVKAGGIDCEGEGVAAGQAASVGDADLDGVAAHIVKGRGDGEGPGVGGKGNPAWQGRVITQAGRPGEAALMPWVLVSGGGLQHLQGQAVTRVNGGRFPQAGGQGDGQCGRLVHSGDGEAQEAVVGVRNAVITLEVDVDGVVLQPVDRGVAQVGEVGGHDGVWQGARLARVSGQGVVIIGAVKCAAVVHQGAGITGYLLHAAAIGGDKLRQAGDDDVVGGRSVRIVIAVGRGGNVGGHVLNGGQVGGAHDCRDVILAGDGEDDQAPLGSVGAVDADIPGHLVGEEEIDGGAHRHGIYRVSGTGDGKAEIAVLRHLQAGSHTLVSDRHCRCQAAARAGCHCDRHVGDIAAGGVAGQGDHAVAIGVVRHERAGHQGAGRCHGDRGGAIRADGIAGDGASCAAWGVITADGKRRRLAHVHPVITRQGQRHRGQQHDFKAVGGLAPFPVHCGDDDVVPGARADAGEVAADGDHAAAVWREGGILRLV